MTKITQLDALTTQAAGDLIVIVDDVSGSPETKKITIENLFQGIPVDMSFGQEATISTVAGDIKISPNTGKALIGPATLPANPDGTLHVHTATAGAVTAHASADEIVVENSANAGMSILTPNDATGAIYFGDEDDNNAGRILYVHSTPFMRLIVEATEVIDFLETEIQARFPIKIKESAAAVADTAIYGQLWVKNTDPNELWFTDGDGQDNQVAYVV